MALTSTSSTPSAPEALIASSSDGPGSGVVGHDRMRRDGGDACGRELPDDRILDRVASARLDFHETDHEDLAHRAGQTYFGSFQVPMHLRLERQAAGGELARAAARSRAPRRREGRGRGETSCRRLQFYRSALPQSNCLRKPCQQRKYSGCSCADSSACARRPDHVARLEHERHRVLDARGLRQSPRSTPSRTSPRRARARTCSCAGSRRRAGSLPPWRRTRRGSGP